MAVNLHRQRATVLMSQPTTHSRNIDTGLDAGRSKQMTQIMVGDSRNAKPPTGISQRPIAFRNAHYLGTSGLMRSFSLNSFEKPAHFRNHRDDAYCPVLRASFIIATNKDFAAIKVAVRPSNVFCLALAITAIRQKFDEVGRIAAEPFVHRSDTFSQRMELSTARQLERLKTHFHRLDKPSRIIVSDTCLNWNFKNCSECLHRLVEVHGACYIACSPHETVLFCNFPHVHFFEYGPCLQQRADTLLAVGLGSRLEWGVAVKSLAIDRQGIGES